LIRRYASTTVHTAVVCCVASRCFLHTIVEGCYWYKSFESEQCFASYHTFICIENRPGDFLSHLRLTPQSITLRTARLIFVSGKHWSQLGFGSPSSISCRAHISSAIVVVWGRVGIRLTLRSTSLYLRGCMPRCRGYTQGSTGGCKPHRYCERAVRRCHPLECRDRSAGKRGAVLVVLIG